MKLNHPTENIEKFIENLRFSSQEELIKIISEVTENIYYNQNLQNNFLLIEKTILSQKTISDLFIQTQIKMKELFQVDEIGFTLPQGSELLPFLSEQAQSLVLLIDSKIISSSLVPDQIKIIQSGNQTIKNFFPLSKKIQSAVVLPCFNSQKFRFSINLGSREFSRFDMSGQTDYLQNLTAKFDLCLNMIFYQEELARTLKEKDDLAQKLAQQNQELIELNKMKDDLLSIASHDLRSPLMGMISIADMMSKDSKLPENYIKWLKQMVSTGNNQLKFINELLNVAKFQKGTLKIERKKFDLIQSLRQVMIQAQPILIKKELKINFITDLDHLTVESDQEKLIQVLNNLISNAVKFSFVKGEIELNLSLQKESYTIKVKDCGIGWEEFEPDKLFTAFTPYSREGTEGEPTSGLGLSICKNIVELLGGEIWAQSPGKNQGAEFSIKLYDYADD